MLPSTTDDGSVGSGFLPQLEPLLGSGSFDTGYEDTRFAVLLGSETRLAHALRSTWDGLRAELPTTPGVLRHAAEAAGKGCANLQRELTGLRETSRFHDLDVAIRSLSYDDLRRAAWISCD
jgi:hypothetical protein